MTDNRIVELERQCAEIRRQILAIEGAKLRDINVPKIGKYYRSRLDFRRQWMKIVGAHHNHLIAYIIGLNQDGSLDIKPRAELWHGSYDASFRVIDEATFIREVDLVIRTVRDKL